MKRYNNFINEKIGRPKKTELNSLIGFLEKNTKYTFVEYKEEFLVEKFDYKSKFNSILYLMVDEKSNTIERKAIRFNFTNFNIFSIDMWEDFSFNLEKGEKIYNKPSYELKIPHKLMSEPEKIKSFVEGNFLEEIKELNGGINESPNERVESEIYDLDDYDLDVFEIVKANVIQLAFNSNSRALIISGLSGLGKCLAKGTKVIMSDGSLKNVEDIMDGEYVMGPDSQPKLVSGTNSGVSEMYEIQQNKGLNYTVNKDHILTLKKADYIKKKNHLTNYPDIVNISIEDYMKKNNYWKKSFFGYKVELNFEEKKLPIEPYFIGLWLGDGYKHETSICSVDDEIIDYIYDYGERIDQLVSKNETEDRISTYHIIDRDFQKKGHKYKNRLFEEMKNLNLIHNKHIPSIYKNNSTENRLELLAGLLDSDRYCIDGAGYEITQKRKDLIYDIKYVADSLGFKTNITETTKKIKKINFEGLYYRLTIWGDVDRIPLKLKRKISTPKRKVNHKITGFKIIEKPISEYYGFTVKDSLYLLEDTTVIHNTFEVRATLEEFKKEYKYFKGNTSSAGLYELLFRYREDLIVLDDMDDALTDKPSRDILKAVLDTGDERIVSRKMKGYYYPDNMSDEEIKKKYLEDGKLPNQFSFTGSVIFITNLTEEEVDPVIFTRVIHVDVNLEQEQIIERIRKIMPKMLPSIPLEDKEETLKFMIKLLDTFEEKAPLNLRSFYHCINIRYSNNFPVNDVKLWKILVKNFLVRKTKKIDSVDDNKI